ncbi:MAG: CBS domain-containing protein [Pseudomonadota bacterium]
MKATARQIMTTQFDSISEDAPVLEAARLILAGRVRESGHKTVSLLVTNSTGEFAGMISMLDILYHIRPPFADYLLEDLDINQNETPFYIERFKGMSVHQVMNSPVPTISPDAHILKMADLMAKKRVRNLPVVEDSRVVGIVYISEVFNHMCRAWLDIS